MKNWIEFWFNSIFNFAKLFTIFDKNIEFGAVQKYVNLVDLEKCCKMSIWLQNLASIQPRTSPNKLCSFRSKIGLKYDRIYELSEHPQRPPAWELLPSAPVGRTELRVSVAS